MVYVNVAVGIAVAALMMYLTYRWGYHTGRAEVLAGKVLP